MPYLSVITYRWVGIVLGYGYEYYQDKLDALAENSLRIELDKKRKSKANLANYTEMSKTRVPLIAHDDWTE